MIRSTILALMAALLTLSPSPGTVQPAAPGGVPDPGAAAEAVRYTPPVPAPFQVVRPFEPPPDPYAAGHRGVDLATGAGQVVLAAGPGVVAFAGQVAGRGVVTITHPDGVITEYEPVVPSVTAGQSVGRGEPIGRVSGVHGDCAPGRCLHWGARRGEDYLDPLGLLAPLGPVRLLPWSTGTG